MRLIDADAIDFDYSGLAYIYPTDFNGISKYFADQVKSAPTIEPRRGEWVDTVIGVEIKRCSACNEKFRLVKVCVVNFCPNCGADMRNEGKRKGDENENL